MLFCNYLHLIYPSELEVKDTADTQLYVCYINFYLGIYNR